MQADLLAQGVALMLYGMGTVVAFLALLVLGMSLMTRCIERFFPETPASLPTAVSPARGRDAAGDELVAVVTAAVKQYRDAHKQGAGGGTGR